ncbi:MAG TPA: glycerol-3-phosphate 1-O-acyltransferase PlsY [Nitrospiraceae bacterium]|jgi:glycerol-3-phosphate acyltransferase PlsY|nr:glycerol-3-phosphate 1-O-acyltransferase PlsY [Nitrospiraceae bacterium]
MTSSDWTAIGLAASGYLLGGVPFGVVVTRGLGAVDPRTAGSRNVGFTNVLRVAGTKAGILTLLGDLGKGWLIAWLAARSLESQGWVLLVALTPVLGHVFSPFLKFRGGKGVATALGAVLGVAPWMGLLLVTIWLIMAATWRYSSGAAITAFVAFPLLALGAQRSWQFSLFAIALSALILQRHRENLRRLWQGTEPKLGQRKS